MTRSASLTEFARNPDEYVDRVAEHGERLVLTRDGTPVADLRPLTALRPTLAELWESLPPLAPGDAEAFVRDLESAHEEMNRAPIRDPWGS